MEKIAKTLTIDLLKKVGASQNYSRANLLSKNFSMYSTHSHAILKDTETEFQLELKSFYHPAGTDKISIQCILTASKPSNPDSNFTNTATKSYQCSCEEKENGCKHVVVMLLHFMRNFQAFSSSHQVIEEVKIQEKENEDLLKQGDVKSDGSEQSKPKRRTLPQWMTSTSTVDAKKVKRNTTITSTRVILSTKLFSTKPSYTFDEQELLLAAQEYLKVSFCSLFFSKKYFN